MTAHPLLDPEIPLSAYREIDLSINNALLGEALKDATSYQSYVDGFLKRNNCQVAYGGYLERRNLYRDFGHFNPSGGQARQYHLGVDFWIAAGTSVHATWEGRVHSWSDRAFAGDYGPVLILEHRVYEKPLYSLYGHLSRSSLSGLRVGKDYQKGDLIGHLGDSEENGGYAPHLHFQLIWELQDYQGDYPGVCSESDLDYYRQNCPDPMAYLSFFRAG